MERLRRPSARPLVALALSSLAAAASCAREPAPPLPPAGTPAVPPGPGGDYVLETRPSKAVSAVYRLSVRAPRLVAREWVLFAPRPPDLPGQRIVVARTSPAGETVRDLGPLGRPLLRARVRADSPGLENAIAFEVRVEAQLFSRRLVRRKGGGPPEDAKRPTAEARALALRETREFDHGSPAVGAWLDANDLNRRAGEADVDLARRVFLAIVRNFDYEHLGEQERAASHVARAGRSDCGGLAALFVAALRSQGVPARTLAGRWARSAVPGERAGPSRYLQEHVKAEFFASGVGWVPADLSSAVLHDASPEKLRHFGNDDGDFLAFHVDTDLEIDTIHFGRRTVTYLQKAAYWATGSGGFDGAVVDEGWRVEPSSGPRERR